MTETKLSLEDIDFILQSLKYTKDKFENYEYPSYEFKRKRLDDVEKVISKVSAIKKEINK